MSNSNNKSLTKYCSYCTGNLQQLQFKVNQSPEQCTSCLNRSATKYYECNKCKRKICESCKDDDESLEQEMYETELTQKDMQESDWEPGTDKTISKTKSLKSKPKRKRKQTFQSNSNNKRRKINASESEEDTDIDNVIKQLKAMKEKKKNIDEYKNEIEELTKQNENLKKTQKQKENKINSLHKKYQQKCKAEVQLIEAHTNECNKVKNECANKVKQIEKEYENKINSSDQKYQQKCTEEVQLIATHKNECDKVKNECEDKMKQIKKEYGNKCNTLHKEWDDKVKALLSEKNNCKQLERENDTLNADNIGLKEVSVEIVKALNEEMDKHEQTKRELIEKEKECNVEKDKSINIGQELMCWKQQKNQLKESYNSAPNKQFQIQLKMYLDV